MHARQRGRHLLLDTCLQKLDLLMFLTVSPSSVALSDPSDAMKALAHLPIGRLPSIPFCVPLLPARLAGARDDDKKVPGDRGHGKVRSSTRGGAAASRAEKRVITMFVGVIRVVNAAGAIATGGSRKFDALVEDIRKSEQWRPDFRDSLGWVWVDGFFEGLCVVFECNVYALHSFLSLFSTSGPSHLTQKPCIVTSTIFLSENITR
ncbi:hypothetical protein EDC04DRAFT_943372 [Pisolithus marmoratus]|nr:hypothetical protein EDC04DRAFT_943372 [Pisolithus marmoratus]